MKRGTSLPNQIRDRDAAARNGVDPGRDHDQDPYYSSEEACWPVDTTVALGVCPIDGTHLYDNGCHVLQCEWTGHTYPYPEDVRG